MAMSIEAFEQRYDSSRKGLNELLRLVEVGDLQAKLPAEIVEEASTALEELHVAAEVMHQQSEQLAQAQYLIENERFYFQELFDLAPDGYLVTDQDCIVRRANRAAAEIF